MLKHSYTFMRRRFSWRGPVRPCVAQDIRRFRALLVWGTADLRAEWDAQPLMTDASGGGYAVAQGDWSAEEVKVVAELDERWRFRRRDAVSVLPQMQALKGTDVFADECTVLPGLQGEMLGQAEMDQSFPRLPEKGLESHRWRELWSAPFVFGEDIHVKEARGVFAAVRHRARDATRFGRRLLIINGNMSCVLALSKGRAHSAPLLRICQRVAIHSLVTQIRFHYRWVVSERNAADAGSRRF